ncbi:dTDP-glucose 4,6-dehydratase [Gammaproteobacteria bacterium]|nr:dTDP-glucose 4,6-dehydratase [Gammaproteobacteria bacterium]
MNFLITGGAGFIGSAVVRHLINNTDHNVLNIDKLTYASNLESVSAVSNSDRYQFLKIDICNIKSLEGAFIEFTPDIVMHLAAETHVDRSIDDPDNFITSNIIGTYNLLKVAKKYWANLPKNKKVNFRFHNISTDEVFGDLKDSNESFNESASYFPSSPYSASKASADHLVRSWHRTYDFPAIITHCSNNYGPFQFPEKLIPTIILNVINKKPIPIFGDGNQIRDWLHVQDHAEALILCAMNGEVGGTYNIGDNNEIANIDLVHRILKVVEGLDHPLIDNSFDYKLLIQFIEDRPGHDQRYSIDSSKINKKLNWSAKKNFDDGIDETIKWYLDNHLLYI